KHVDIKCISGGTISDAQKALMNNESYDKVILQIGSNDCAKGDPAKNIVDDYKLLLSGAKAISKDVSISSICPRTDNKEAHEKAQAVNAELQVLCEHTDNTSFINNDNTFILQDGTINDGFLNRDGLHLNPAGTNRLVHNMGLTKSLKRVTKPFNQYKKSQIPNPIPRPNSNSNSNSSKPTSYANAIKSPRPNLKPVCFKCGEASHLASTCWHPSPVRCYFCKNLGHKTAKCPNKDHQPIETSNRY
ncbi:unnamed protein product, partial [Owenia fusiformis]